jgi:hypothetical protein
MTLRTCGDVDELIGEIAHVFDARVIRIVHVRPRVLLFGYCRKQANRIKPNQTYANKIQ